MRKGTGYSLSITERSQIEKLWLLAEFPPPPKTPSRERNGNANMALATALELPSAGVTLGKGTPVTVFSRDKPWPGKQVTVMTFFDKAHNRQVSIKGNGDCVVVSDLTLWRANNSCAFTERFKRFPTPILFR